MKSPKKSVVILRWNPAFSSFGTTSLSHSLNMMNAHPRGHLDWSVYDYEHVHKGDECFLLKVGDGPIGVCLYGICIVVMERLLKTDGSTARVICSFPRAIYG